MKALPGTANFMVDAQDADNETECLRDEPGVGVYGCFCRACCQMVREEADGEGDL